MFNNNIIHHLLSNIQKMQAVPVLSSAFNYTSSSVSTIGYLTSFVASTFSSYNSLPSSLILNSALKVTTLTEVPNFMF
ncbi:unnamed protein product [Rotaria sp. Silwood1]|nr:unnamed protein product [Rotaria sp. Silwood1]